MTFEKSIILGVVILASFTFQSAHAESFCAAEKVLKSPVSSAKTKITFVNESKDFTRNVYWLNFDGVREIHDAIKPNGRVTIDSFVGHIYVVTDSNKNCKAVLTTDRDGSTILFN